MKRTEHCLYKETCPIEVAILQLQNKYFVVVLSKFLLFLYRNMPFFVQYNAALISIIVDRTWLYFLLTK